MIMLYVNMYVLQNFWVSCDRKTYQQLILAVDNSTPTQSLICTAMPKLWQRKRWTNFKHASTTYDHTPNATSDTICFDMGQTHDRMLSSNRLTFCTSIHVLKPSSRLSKNVSEIPQQSLPYTTSRRKDNANAKSTV